MTTRRKFLWGLSSLIVAPAVVRASSLMPIKTYPEEALYLVNKLTGKVLDVLDFSYGAGRPDLFVNMTRGLVAESSYFGPNRPHLEFICSPETRNELERQAARNRNVLLMDSRDDSYHKTPTLLETSFRSIPIRVAT